MIGGKSIEEKLEYVSYIYLWEEEKKFKEEPLPVLGIREGDMFE